MKLTYGLYIIDLVYTVIFFYILTFNYMCLNSNGVDWSHFHNLKTSYTLLWIYVSGISIKWTLFAIQMDTVITWKRQLILIRLRWIYHNYSATKWRMVMNNNRPRLCFVNLTRAYTSLWTPYGYIPGTGMNVILVLTFVETLITFKTQLLLFYFNC